MGSYGKGCRRDDDVTRVSTLIIFALYSHDDGYDWFDFGSICKDWAARALDRLDGFDVVGRDYLCARESSHYEDAPLYFVDFFVLIHIFLCIYKIIFWQLS